MARSRHRSLHRHRALRRHRGGAGPPSPLHWSVPLALILGLCLYAVYLGKVIGIDTDDYFPFPFHFLFAPIVLVLFVQLGVACFVSASVDLQNVWCEIPDDPVFSGPDGEIMVPVPHVEEKMKSAFGVFWCCVKRHIPRVRGLPRGVVPLPSNEKEALLDRLAGHWKIQPLPGGISTVPVVAHENVFINGDAMVLSGGMHNACAGAGSRGHPAARANETQESRLVPFRDKRGALYLDQIGSRVAQESADGGELELETALGVRLLLQREWKRQGHVPPVPPAPLDDGDECIPIAHAVETSGAPSDGKRDIGNEILQLKHLYDEGALSEKEFSETKTALLKQWTGSRN